MRRGQFAMEYLLVIGFSLLLILPITVVMFQSYQSHKQDIHIDHLSSLAEEIAYQSEKLYYQGAPATTTIVASIPEGVNRTEVSGTTIEFYLEDTTRTAYADAGVPVKGVISPAQGKHTLTLRMDDQGTVNDPTDDFINITDR
ncbi:MAG: hypothetical protein ACLFO2_04920 [Candidatus Woesearchaeota archaeon]